MDQLEPLTEEQIQLYAARYQWLREQHWYDGLVAVVTLPKESVKLGYTCPSKELLDAFVDAERLK